MCDLSSTTIATAIVENATTMITKDQMDLKAQLYEILHA